MAKAGRPINPERRPFLIPKHITTQEELDDLELAVIEQAQTWLYGGDRPELTLSFVCTLHRRMFDGIWSDAGAIRKRETNIGVDPRQIQVRLTQLMMNLQMQLQGPPSAAAACDEIAARFHHQLVYIHPFPDGNGRHARLVTDYLLRRVLDVVPFTWGSAADIRIEGPWRDRYIAALRVADWERDYKPLLAFVRS